MKKIADREAKAKRLAAQPHHCNNSRYCKDRKFLRETAGPDQTVGIAEQGVCFIPRPAERIAARPDR
ncbi:MAG: hypothetical protein ACYS18_05710 [Planctomycetota bacterium]